MSYFVYFQPSAMNESVDAREGSEVEISRLFPKCRPRSTPSSPINPPATPIPSTLSTTFSTSHTASYPPNISSIHAAVDYAPNATKNSFIQAALNHPSHLNPSTISFSTNNLTHHGYTNSSAIITSSSIGYNTTNALTHSVHNECAPLNVKTIHTPVISHHNFNCVTGSDDNDNFAPSHPTADEVARMQESSSSNSSSTSSNSSGSNSSSRMSVDTASSNFSPGGGGVGNQVSIGGGSMNNSVDVSVVSGYHEPDHSRSSVLDSSYEDAPLPQSRREHFRLRDSRIEAAGGREVYSQSRSRMHHHRHRSGNGSQVTMHHNSLLQNQQHLKQQQQLVQLQQQIISSRPQNSNAQNNDHLQQQTQPLDNSSASSSCSRTSRESGLPPDSPLVYEARFPGSSEVVFDDIGEWDGGLTVRGMDEHTNASSTPTSGPDSESPEVSPTRVTKIGNVPIADYEGSPRRYGPRSATVRCSPRRGHSMRPRPGFPRRVSSHPEDGKSAEKMESTGEDEQNIKKEKWMDSIKNNSCSETQIMESPTPPIISISTLTSVYGPTHNEISSPTTTTTSTMAANKCATAQDDIIYDYEVSETQKVLQEFFQDSRVSRTPPQAFYDLEYHLKRHHGNSYVGQRLAEEYEADGSSHPKDSSQVMTEENLGQHDAHKPVSRDCETKCSTDPKVVGYAEDGQQPDDDQVVNYDNVEVSNRLPSSVHQCSSFSNRHFTHGRIICLEKHNKIKLTSVTPPCSSPSHALGLSHHSSCQHFPSLHCPSITSPTGTRKCNNVLSQATSTSSNFCTIDALNTSSFSNRNRLTSDVATCRQKILQSQNIRERRDFLSSSHSPTLIHSCDVLEEDFLNLSDNQGFLREINCEHFDATSSVNGVIINIMPESKENVDTSDMVELEDDDQDLVDLDEDEEELKVTLNADEETDGDEADILPTEPVNNLLDLPIDCPLLDDYCLIKTLPVLSSLKQPLNQCEAFPDEHEDGERVPLIVSSPVSGLELYLSEASHQVTCSIDYSLVGAFRLIPCCDDALPAL